MKWSQEQALQRYPSSFDEVDMFFPRYGTPCYAQGCKVVAYPIGDEWFVFRHTLHGGGSGVDIFAMPSSCSDKVIGDVVNTWLTQLHSMVREGVRPLRV